MRGRKCERWRRRCAAAVRRLLGRRRRTQTRALRVPSSCVPARRRGEGWGGRRGGVGCGQARRALTPGRPASRRGRGLPWRRRPAPGAVAGSAARAAPAGGLAGALPTLGLAAAGLRAPTIHIKYRDSCAAHWGRSRNHNQVIERSQSVSQADKRETSNSIPMTILRQYYAGHAAYRLQL